MTETGHSPHATRYLVLVCLVAALGGLLFGYDTAVISGAIGFLQDHFALTAAMKGWAASSALLGCVLGVTFSGVFSDFLGRKKTLVLAGVLFLISAIGTALPNDFVPFILFRILGGVGVGVASMASPMYIAEITPAAARGRMVSVNQFAIISGMLVIYFVNYFIAQREHTPWRALATATTVAGLASPDGQPWHELGSLAAARAMIQTDWNVREGWRWMFASGTIPSLLFLVLLLFVPESPRWLSKQGRAKEARRILERVGGTAFAEAELESIQLTVAQERTEAPGLLAPGLRRVLVIGIALAVLQQVTGINVILYYAPEIFKKIGSRVDTALLQTIVVGAVNLAFTIVAIRTVDKLGRKPLMIIGAAGMGLSLTAMGVLEHLQIPSVGMLWCILAFTACFALSVGPVTWVILSEIFPNRIRGRALSVATFCLWTANLVISQTYPMMDEDPWLVDLFHHGFPFYVYAFFCVVLVLTVWRFVPETKGRSLEEIERSWSQPQ